MRLLAVDKGMKISLGFSVSLLLQMRRFAPDILAGFQKLVSHENVELVAVEPYHSFIFYLDIAAFAERMAWGKQQLEETFQKRIFVTDTTEMFMSNDIYFQLQLSGFKGAVMDGRLTRLVYGKRKLEVYLHAGKGVALATWNRRYTDGAGIGPCSPIDGVLRAIIAGEKAYSVHWVKLLDGPNVQLWQHGTLTYRIGKRKILAVVLARKPYRLQIAGNTSDCV